jgi:RimJ/RimL family protein N-acetyltransferase
VTVEPAPTIVTERLVLTRLARGDVDDLVAMLLNPALYHWIGGAPASPAEAGNRVERWLSGSSDPDVLWINHVARGRDDSGLVGLAQATVQEAREARAGTCEIAYLVDPSAQRHGFGTEMMLGFCAELRESVRPAEFTAHILPGHVASEGVVRSLGLTPTPDRVDGEQVWRTTTR